MKAYICGRCSRVLGKDHEVCVCGSRVVHPANIDLEFSDGTVDKQPETKILTKSEPKKPRTKWTTIPDGWTGHHSDSELYFVDDLEIGDEITETTIEDILG